MRFPAFLLSLVLNLAPAAGFGAVRLPAVFSDHLVLQRSGAVPIWGWAAPGETVSVSLAAQSAKATANALGRWQVALDLRDIPAGPFSMTVAGANRFEIADVVIGQVWMTAGQSNMELQLKLTAHPEPTAAQSADPLLREFKVTHEMREAPADDCKGRWVLSSPQSSPEFSAIGYYFGRKLRSELHQPIGLINNSWGGTMLEAWVSRQVVESWPTLRKGAERIRQQQMEFPGKRDAFVKAFGEWLERTGRKDRMVTPPDAFASDAVDPQGWTPVQLPGALLHRNLPSNGAIWFRKEIELTKAELIQPIKPSIGPLTGFATVYWNGQKVSDLPYQKSPGENYPVYFQVPRQVLRAGRNVIAIRFFAPARPVAFLQSPANFIAGPVRLNGEWLAKAEYELSPLSAREQAAVPPLPARVNEVRATEIFNGMVNPFIPFALSGILWYQGESNTGLAYQYRTLFSLFIQDLRSQWHDSRLPFYYCQLSNFGPKTAQLGASSWAELREAQSLALVLPATGEAILDDLGESDNIHYLNKADVAERLARIALSLTYGRQKEPYAGPRYRSKTIQQGAIRIDWVDDGGGLVARPLSPTYPINQVLQKVAPLAANSPGSELEGFAVCGADRKWHWAQAKIDGTGVLVSAPEVPAPQEVRYDWSDNPSGNLYDAAGLPAAPFRTDAFPLSTQAARFGLPSLAARRQANAPSL